MWNVEYGEQDGQCGDTEPGMGNSCLDSCIHAIYYWRARLSGFPLELSISPSHHRPSLHPDWGATSGVACNMGRSADGGAVLATHPFFFFFFFFFCVRPVSYLRTYLAHICSASALRACTGILCFVLECVMWVWGDSGCTEANSLLHLPFFFFPLIPSLPPVSSGGDRNSQ